MPADETLLEDIVDAAAQIAHYIEGLDRPTFLADRKTQDAVVRRIEVMGEAATRLSPQLRDAHPEVDWKGLAQLRNFYIHVYRRINYHKVWRTCRNSIPSINTAAEQVAASLTDDT